MHLAVHSGAGVDFIEEGNLEVQLSYFSRAEGGGGGGGGGSSSLSA